MWLMSGPEESAQTLKLAYAAKRWTVEGEDRKMILA